TRFSRDWSSDVCSSDLASCRAAARGTAMKSRRALSLAGEGRPVRSDLATGSFDTPSWKPFALQERPPEQVEGGLSAPGLDGAPVAPEPVRFHPPPLPHPRPAVALADAPGGCGPAR